MSAVLILTGAEVFGSVDVRATEPTSASHVGSQVCAGCHPTETARWGGSDHDRAMEEATESSVLGDFGGAEFTANGVTSRFFRRDGRYFVRTDGPDGALRDYPSATPSAGGRCSNT